MLTILLAASVHAQEQKDECQDGERVIRFNYVIPAKGNPKGEGIEELARRVNAEMDGRFCMLTFPAGTLYTNIQSIEAIRSGDLEMIAPPTSKLEELNRKFPHLQSPVSVQEYSGA